MTPAPGSRANRAGFQCLLCQLVAPGIQMNQQQQREVVEKSREQSTANDVEIGNGRRDHL